MIRVTIVEDNDTIRYGLREYINDTKDFECVAEYSNCEELLSELTEQPTDIVLMDIELPGISGIEGIKEIGKIVKNQKIIILTIYSESENLFAALSAGAFGYIEKKSPPLQMLKIIQEVYLGKSNMNTYIARKVYSFFKSNTANEDEQTERLDENEYKILKNLINGNSPKAISDKLDIPSDSVYRSLYNVYEKLHIKFGLKKIQTVK